MKSIVSLSVLSVFASTVAVQAADLQSGLKEGDRPDPFYVVDVTGPSAGEELCYRCRYGAQPVVTIFTRSMNDDVKNLVKQVDEVVGKNKDDKMAAFVVLLTDEPESQEEALKAIAKEEEIVNTPLTTYENAEGPRKYRISKDAEVTVMMWVESDVKVTHAFEAGKLNKDSITQIVSDTSKILN